MATHSDLIQKSDRPAPIAGVAIVGAGVALAVATLVLSILDRDSPPPYALAGLDVSWSLVVRTLVQTVGLITASSISGILVWRRPKALLSLIVLVTVAFLQLRAFASEYAIYGLLVAPGSLPLADVAAWTQELGGVVGLGALMVLLLFPNGRLKSRRWWPLVGIAILSAAADMLVNLDNPYSISLGLMARQWVPVTLPPAVWPVGASLTWASGAVFWAGQAVPILAALYLVLRLIQAAGEERLQLRWFTYTAAIFSATGLLGLADSPPPADWLPEPVRGALIGFASSDAAHAVGSWSGLGNALAGMVLLPVAIGIAIARYRLYDIDVVINRTILYGGLALFVTGSYAIVVGGVGSLLGQHAGLNPVLSVATIAVLAALLLPVRGRLQDLANAAVYGKRARPYDVLSDFAASIGRAEPADVLLPRMAELLRQGTGASTTEVWAKVGDRLQLAASSPPALAQPPSILAVDEVAARFSGGASIEPVSHDGRVLGALVVVKPRGEELTAVERRLFRDLASQAGLVLVRFQLVQELRESRSRIVASQDLERHRIERNLHDGAQQRFVNALLALGMAREGANHKGDGSGLLDEASREVQAGLNELRSLARGLQPPLLAESGIVAAVTRLGDHAPIPTTVLAATNGRYPEVIESAAYFVVAEALTNAVKHSHANGVEVRINEAGGWLRVEVRDNGAGGADPKGGSGIVGLQDRVAAVGGRMTFESPAAGGTVIRVELPCK